ncbi:protein kinase domain-containing protein [Streptomyces vilmorinianum]|uniref:serine/threonine-protein kinase n=1 Tax=Streptomyces vilmorinianum TaxID=3051092 RepID=UPI001586AB1B|nr:serine/threonine-protein kinase [Streptomyces vilmorinianum]
MPGPSLAEAVVRSGALPVAAVRALGAALARALDAVHGVQVLHRDLKPANVLLGAAGPKLIDFGIAQAFEATALTSTGLVVGSPGFMSPEHLVGSRAVVPASDVFCLGAVLAFAASGRGPFHDDEMAAVIFRISRADAELSGVPAELRPVVERCLRLDPAERPSAAELVGLLGGQAVPEVFPWPGGVLSLLAEYGDAARRTGEAAASGAGVADLPTVAPVVPYSPTAAGYRPAVPDPVVRRRPWGRIVAGAVAVAVAATVGVVMVNRSGGQGSSTGGAGGASGPSAGPGTGTAQPATLSQVVLPYGGEGHTGDFGAVGEARTSRPAGWSPWQREVDAGMGACALSPEVLVCAGSGGAAVGLRAADGEKVWSVPGRGEAPRSAPQYPAVTGDAVHITGPDGVITYGLKDGKERGQLPAPGKEWAVKGTDLLGGVLYSTYVDVADERTGLVTATKLEGGRAQELWRTPLDALPEQPVAAGGRVFVPVDNVPVALDARTGTVAARGAGGCGKVTVHKESVLCSGRQEGGVAVLDSRTLKTVRTLGEGTSPSAGPAVNADGVVALVHDGGTVVTYDLASGRERWRTDLHVSRGHADRVYFVGDQVLAGGKHEVNAIPVAGPSVRPEEFTAALPDDFTPTASAEVLAAGGAVFLALSDGLVVSAYLP